MTPRIVTASLVVLILSALGLLVLYQRGDGEEYEYAEFEYAHPATSVLIIHLSCPNGRSGRSAKETADLAFAQIKKSDDRAKAIGKSLREGNNRLSLDDMRKVDRESVDLVGYIEDDLGCDLDFQRNR